ncbi:MAG TPA: tryptophan dimethylallyltransferase family protein [Polyangiaceae bacterium]|nr:tryptophan dimethylallyltransferase family protein [Polyangiaceae bacterium]
MLEFETTVGTLGSPSAVTLGQQLESRLRRLLSALGQLDHLERSLRIIRTLTSSWHSDPMAAGPKWSSDITDDHSPFEFSLALDGKSEMVRILTEPQNPDNPSLQTSWSLGQAVHEELAGRWGAGLRDYGKVADLFAPSENDRGVFSIWHSAILGCKQGVEFKVYLNPAIHGASDAERVTGEAFARLGLGQTWRVVREKILCRARLDRLVYFSLDLTEAAGARAKIYVAHDHATADDVCATLAWCPGFGNAEVVRWCEHLMEGNGPFRGRPPISCFAFSRGTLDLHTTTLHLPVRSYASDDFEAARRICAYLPFRQRVRYMRALTELAERPLESGPGLQTYASLRASPRREALTVYLAPQVYSEPANNALEVEQSLFGRAERASNNVTSRIAL